MAKNLKQLWDNTPKTPLSAENLSKYIETKAEKSILFLDNAARTPNTDGHLKIRAGSVVPIAEKATWAYFNFNESYVSHDGEFSPTIAQNASFTPEIMNDNMSLAVESESTNLINDVNFSKIDDTQYWIKTSNGSSTITKDSSTFYGSAVLKFATDTLGNKIELSKTMSTSLQNMVFGNFSFYYNTEDTGSLKLVVQGLKDGVLQYWRNDTETWSDTEYVVEVPNSDGDWMRFEVPRINFILLNSTTITLKIYSTDGNKTSYISKPQYEIGTYSTDFCSSFTPSTRSSARLEYPPAVVDLRQGTIDFNILQKTERSFTIFSLKDSGGNNVFSLEYICDTSLGIYKYVLSIKDYSEQAMITLEKNINPILFVGKWRRMLITWNMSSGFLMKTQILSSTDTSSDFQVTKSFTYTPVPRQNLQTFILGSNGVSSPNYLNGILNSFKINVDDKSTEDITADFIKQIAIDPIEYRVFESGEEDITIDPSYLLPSYNETSFEANSSYIVVYKDGGNRTADIIVLKGIDDLLGSGIKKRDVKILGGFNTDSNGSPIYNTVWDIYQNKIDTVETNRVLVRGKNSDDAKFEIKTIPESDEDKVVVKIPSYYNNFIYGRTTVSSSPFMTIDPAGAFYFDDLSVNGFNSTTIDSQTFASSNISTMNGKSLVMTSNSSVNGEYVSGHSNIVMNASSINVNSGTSGIVYIDAVRVKGNNIYSDPLSDLVINSDKASKNIVIDSTNGNVNIHSNYATISTDHDSVDIDNINIRNNLITSLAGVLQISAASTVDVNSGTGSITLDNFTFKTDTVSDVNMVISGTTSLTMQSSTTNVVLNNNDATINGKNNISLIAGQKITLSAPEIDFLAANSGKIISLDSIKIDENTLYTSGSDFNIKTLTSGNLNFTAATNIVTQSTQLNASAANMTFSTSSSSITLDGLKIASTSLYSTSTAALTFGNNNSTINLAATGQTVNINATTTNISGNVNLTSSASIVFNTSDAARSRLRYLADVPSWSAAINSSSGNSGLVVDGDFAAEQIWNAIYNDLAECWVRDPDEAVEYCEVIVQTEKGVRKSRRRAERGTVGVASNSFGYILGSAGYNKDLAKSEKVPIAISGRGKVKYLGKVRIGDEMTSCEDGFAVKANIIEKIFKRERLIGRVDSIDSDQFCWIKVY